MALRHRRRRAREHRRERRPQDHVAAPLLPGVGNVTVDDHVLQRVAPDAHRLRGLFDRDQRDTNMTRLVVLMIAMLLFPSPSQALAQSACDDTTGGIQATTMSPDDAEERESNALGLTGAEWIEIFGEPIDSPLPEPMARFGNDDLEIDVPLFNAESRITGFTVRFETSVEFAIADEIVTIAIPVDAERLEAYPAPVSDSCVVLYHSDWLAEVIEPNPELEALGLDQWINAEPGDFIVLYGWEDADPSTERVSWVIVAIGNNPSGNTAASGQQSNPTSVPAPNGADDEPTDQEDAYIDALNDQVDTVSEASRELSVLFSDAGIDPTLFLDQRWIIDVAAQFVTVQQLEVEAQLLQPSERQQGIHDVWIEITRLLTLAVDDFTFGIDNLEPASIEQGTERFVWATTLTEDLQDALTAFDDNPNIAFEPTYPLFSVETCDQFSDFNVAQEYYAANPEDQLTIDPDLDGLACEVFFEEE